MYRVFAGKLPELVKQEDVHGKTEFFRQDEAMGLFFDCTDRAPENSWDEVVIMEYVTDRYGYWRISDFSVAKWKDGKTRKDNGKVQKA